MAANFFDTSALGQHYHQEVGSSQVDQLLAAPGSRHFVSRLSVVEIYSVFGKKVRTGILSLADFQLLGRRFRSDARLRVFQVLRVTSPLFRAAEQLVRRLSPAQNLRTLDALQLAVALDLRSRGLVTQFVCADQRLCTIAAGEGRTVVNPELP
jgi:predicted nucleic acid-binding protein